MIYLEALSQDLKLLLALLLYLSITEFFVITISHAHFNYHYHHISNLASHLTAGLERTLALATGEALLMICVAHGGDDLALHILAARGALGPIQLLVVLCTVVGAILREEAATG